MKYLGVHLLQKLNDYLGSNLSKIKPIGSQPFIIGPILGFQS